MIHHHHGDLFTCISCLASSRGRGSCVRDKPAPTSTERTVTVTVTGIPAGADAADMCAVQQRTPSLPRPCGLMGCWDTGEHIVPCSPGLNCRSSWAVGGRKGGRCLVVGSSFSENGEGGGKKNAALAWMMLFASQPTHTHTTRSPLSAINRRFAGCYGAIPQRGPRKSPTLPLSHSPTPGISLMLRLMGRPYLRDS